MLKGMDVEVHHVAPGTPVARVIEVMRQLEAGAEAGDSTIVIDRSPLSEQLERLGGEDRRNPSRSARPEAPVASTVTTNGFEEALGSAAQELGIRPRIIDGMTDEQRLIIANVKVRKIKTGWSSGSGKTVEG